MPTGERQSEHVRYRTPLTLGRVWLSAGRQEAGELSYARSVDAVRRRASARNVALITVAALAVWGVAVYVNAVFQSQNWE